MLRLTWRKLLAVLIGSVSALSVSCWAYPDYGVAEYGPGPMPDYETISGTVTAGEKPVSGFWVSLLNDRYPNPQYYTFTDINGMFELYIYEYNANENGSYTVFFQDVDGPQNGEFNSKTVQWKSGDGPLNITLESKE